MKQPARTRAYKLTNCSLVAYRASQFHLDWSSQNHSCGCRLLGNAPGGSNDTILFIGICPNRCIMCKHILLRQANMFKRVCQCQRIKGMHRRWTTSPARPRPSVGIVGGGGLNPQLISEPPEFQFQKCVRGLNANPPPKCLKLIPY